jgi:hypothetical protein
MVSIFIVNNLKAAFSAKKFRRAAGKHLKLVFNGAI